MDIIIRVVSPDKMRPNVEGADWFFDDNGDLQVRINPLSDWRREALLGVHEVVEAIMCKYNGVTVAQVDAFDTEYESTHSSDLNAGDDPDAPYVREHCFATAIERILCAELEVNWLSYDTELASKYPGPTNNPT